MKYIDKMITSRYKIHSEGNSRSIYQVYEGIDLAQDPQQHVSIEVFSNNFISDYLEDILNFQNDLSVISKLQHPNIPRIIEFGEFENNHYIVMDLLQGQPLAKYIEQQSALTILQKLDIIIQICQGLACVHKEGIIHKELNPSNILIFEQTKGYYNIRILDFGLAYLKDYTKLKRKDEIILPFHYSSPEISSITRKAVDIRSDLYSIGIIFYELLTGKLPFKASNINAIIHQHIAKLPDKPSLHNPDIPPIIDRIVLKLLEKEPEKRYQSAEGLKSDLEKIKQNSTNFTLGLNDDQIKWNFSPPLTGRQEDMTKIRELFTAFQRGKGQACFIAGQAGIGKTRLLEELQEQIRNESVIVLQGRAFASENANSYSVFCNAITAYIQIYSKYPESRKKAIKTRLNDCLGPLGSILLRLNPDLIEIFDNSPPLIELAYDKNIDRLIHTFCRFIQELSMADNKLVFFLEDLHWASEENFELIESLLLDISDYPILFIATYRNNEIPQEHKLHKIENEAEKKGIPLANISIQPFNFSTTDVFIRNLLHIQEPNCREISEFIFDKSQGNPFFIIEILKQLLGEHALIHSAGSWQIDKQIIKSIEIPTNIIDFVFKSISLLEWMDITILSKAAVIGREFNLTLLYAILKHEEALVVKTINKAISLYLLNRDELNRGTILFVHSRIRNAFYRKIEHQKRKQLHEEIACTILKQNFELRSNQIYELAYHFKESGNSRETLKYSMLAAEWARDKYAHEQAIQYYSQCLRILNETNQQATNQWTQCIEQLGNIYVIIGKRDKAIEMFELLLANCADSFIQARGYKQISESYYKKGDWKNCEENAKLGLLLLHDKLYTKTFPVILDTIKEYIIHYGSSLIPHKRFKVKTSPTLQRDKLILGYYYSLIMTYSLSSILKTAHITVRMLNMARIRVGKSKELANGFMGFATACAVMASFKAALKYLRKSVILTNELEDDWGKGKTYQCLALCYDWMGNYPKGIEYSKKSIEYFNKTGDVTELYMSYSADFHANYMLGNYQEAKLANKNHLKICMKTNDSYGISIAFNNLAQIYICTGEYTMAESKLKQAIELSFINKIWFVNCVSYKDYGVLFLEKGNSTLAIKYLEIAKDLYESNFFIKPYTICIYTFLAEAWLLKFSQVKEDLNSHNLKQMLKKLKALCSKALKKTKPWPAHYGVALRVMSQFYFLQARYQLAKKMALQSLVHNKKYNLKYEYAKTLLEFGKLLDYRNLKEQAQQKWTEAYQIFNEIDSKVYLERTRKFLGFLNQATPYHRLIDRQRLASIIKTSQDLSSILDIDKLLENIIQKAIEVVGAYRGYLFLQNKDTGNLELKAHQHIIENSQIQYIDSVIEKVFQEGEIFISANASQDKKLIKEADIREYRPKSIICMPIKYREKKSGVCYLDNPISTNVFSEDDSGILNVLLNQAAIALENAELYTNSLAMSKKIQSLNEEKEEQKQQLVQADKMVLLGIMASSVAHDIKNPNGAIHSNVTFLKTYSPYIFEMLDDLSRQDKNYMIGNLPYSLLHEKCNQAMDGIIKSTQRIEKIVEDLKMYYRKRKPDLNEKVDFNKVITSSVTLLSFELTKTVTQLDLQLSAELPFVRGDFQQLEQVTVNLLANACFAIKEKTYPEGVTGKLTISTSCDQDRTRIVVSIADNGIGMDAVTLQQITEPFFTTRPTRGGSGLGLNISQRLIKDHNGELTFISEPGEGTIACISLPL